MYLQQVFLFCVAVGGGDDSKAPLRPEELAGIAIAAFCVVVVASGVVVVLIVIVIKKKQNK